MSYNQALRQVIADEINHQRERYSPPPDGWVEPSDILGIDCTWDSGDNYDPTYGSSQSAPTFEFQVRLRPTATTRPWPATVSVSFLMGALFNAILETEL